MGRYRRGSDVARGHPREPLCEVQWLLTRALVFVSVLGLLSAAEHLRPNWWVGGWPGGLG